MPERQSRRAARGPSLRPLTLKDLWNVTRCREAALRDGQHVQPYLINIYGYDEVVNVWDYDDGVLRLDDNDPAVQVIRHWCRQHFGPRDFGSAVLQDLYDWLAVEKQIDRATADKLPLDELAALLQEEARPRGHEHTAAAAPPASAPATPPDEDLGRNMERLAQAVGDDTAVRVLAIVNREDLSGQEKMRLLIRLDQRFKGKDSNQWATLLGVKPQAVRGYDAWKELQQERKSLD
jgi:hypothetical protein